MALTNKGINMPAPIDLTGHVYHRLTILHEESPTTYPRKWVCKCECGTIKTILGASLRNGLTKSCGCLNKEILSEKGTVHGNHGSRLYSIWHNMKQRCGNPKHTGYGFYGALGISVCAAWLDYSPFQEWAMGSGYSEDLSIDRIDGSKGYSPDNCRWASKTIQARNQKRRTTNTSGNVGVSFVPKLNKYQAYLTVNYKKVNLGYYPTAEEASLARQTYINQNLLTGFQPN